MEIFIIVILSAVAIIVITGLKTVPQGYNYVVERFGRFNKVLQPGLNLIMPVFDQISYKINVMEQVLDLPKQTIITKDNATVEVDAVVFYKVIDPKKAAYGVTNLNRAIEQLTMTNLRSIMGKLTLDESLSSRAQINEELGRELDMATDEWGTKITRVEIKDISPPADIQNAMTLQMKAEREKRATILQAEALKEAAQREAEARERLAQADANSIRFVTQAIIEGGMASMMYFIAKEYVNAIKEIAKSNNTTILFIPTDIQDTVKKLLGSKN
ncbi:MAG: SPFH domain-containing protein [Spirochaetia bacterium]|nr:SPFH/Band 7/PHB domain protein [Spirochaetota bacterium]MCX8097191.1 SPFH/Band 7/PHB domain protein [Spirochaetota bacterium]MDW8112636.1 SPFH domain-containing protein [Spirochaetia bacterium]